MGASCFTSKRLPQSSDECQKTSIPSVPLIPSSFPVTESILTKSLSDGITLIWLDPYANSFSNETKTTLYHLHRLSVTSILPYDDVNSCFTLLKSLSYNENNQSSKIILITSGVYALKILPEINSIEIIDSVFIFCKNQQTYEHLMTEYKPLVIDICTTNAQLYKSIVEHLEFLKQETLVFHFFSQEQNTTRNLTKESASFIWFQVFQMIISELTCTINDMDLMLTYCSKQIKNDTKITDSKRKKYLKDIEEFRKNYEKDDAIKWYTKETFVYYLLNQSLRTEDIEALYIFRYYLGDLCRQIKTEHNEFRLNQLQISQTLKLYRGVRIPSTELMSLRHTTGNLISLNGFISSSIKESVALEFLEKQRCQIENNDRILFIFEVDLECKDIIYTYVGEKGLLKDEEEVLFNMGSTFYLKGVSFDDKKQLWEVKMIATDEGIKIASEYMELTRRELNETNVSIVFGQLFLQMGDYPKAYKYFSELHKQSNSIDSHFPSICYHLALIDGYQGNLQEAEDRLNYLLNFHLTRQSNPLDLTRTKNALGWIYHYNGELNYAMDHYKDALQYAKKYIGLNHLIAAQICNFLGDCYLVKLDVNEAEMYYEQALDIEQINLPNNHPRIGVSYNDLGNVYRKRYDMTKALEYYEKAEKIFQEKLPVNHPHIAYCWSCMGFVYLYNENKEEAQEYHRKALKIYQKVLPADHINIKMSEKNSKCTDFLIINDSYIKICAQI